MSARILAPSHKPTRSAIRLRNRSTFELSQMLGLGALEVRAEFTNILNRHFYPAPSPATSNSLNAAYTCSGGIATPGSPTPCQAGYAITGGYGFVNIANGLGATPRAGQIVARFRF